MGWHFPTVILFLLKRIKSEFITALIFDNIFRKFQLLEFYAISIF